MNNEREQADIGRGLGVIGLVLVILVAIAAFLLSSVENAEAQDEAIGVGASATGWIPQGDMNRWYKLDSSAQTLVNITATRTGGDLAPQLTVLFHDGNDYQVAAYDGNYNASNTASLSVLLPVTAVDYWIEVASMGSTSGVFLLSTSRGSTWHQEEDAYNGYKVTFSVDRIVCRDVQDGDGVDELKMVYLIEQHTPTGAAVDASRNQVEGMWMQTGWELNNFAPLVGQVGKDNSVSLTIKLIEQDDGWNDDETLAQRTNTLSAQQLKQVADSGRPATIYWPAGNGQYQYGITYAIYVEKI